MKIGAIDVGTNSTRLLVAQLLAAGDLHLVLKDTKITRLGQGMQSGWLMQAAIERTLAVIAEFAQRAKQAGAQKIVVAATSAVRDAKNRGDFAARVYSITGLDLLVLSGTDEARLSYRGVTNALGDVGKALVVDIGGGSTEFIWRSAGETRFVSTQVGAVRMTESGYGSAHIKGVIDDILHVVQLDNPGELIGVGGTITTLAAMAQMMRHYQPEKIHGFRLTIDKVDELYRLLNSLTIEERKKLPGLQPQRADIIPAGTNILRTIMHGLARDSLLVSEADILEGLIGEAAYNDD